MSMQRCGEDEVLTSIEEGEDINLILIKRDAQSPQISKILNYAFNHGLLLSLFKFFVYENTFYIQLKVQDI